jgi:hypothetical protein
VGRLVERRVEPPAAPEEPVVRVERPVERVVPRAVREVSLPGWAELWLRRIEVAVNGYRKKMTKIYALKKGFALLGGAGVLASAVACGAGAGHVASPPPTTSPPTSSSTPAPVTPGNQGGSSGGDNAPAGGGAGGG